jgi:hypothetical protein
MLKTRFNYWNCSKFADFIRGEKKPKYLEWGEWDNWRDKMKKERPFRYYLSDTLLNKLQDFVCFPSDVYDSIKTYCRNRFITQTHVLKTGLKKGQWYDLDYRILHALFNELVDFVEIELAHLSRWDEYKQYKFKNNRCVEAAYDYFKNVEQEHNEAKKLFSKEPKTSAFYASAEDRYEITKQDLYRSNKIKELYEWWTKIRPNRDNPIDTITEQTHGKHYFRLINEIERGYDLEDTDKLVELVRLRSHLWT